MQALTLHVDGQVLIALYVAAGSPVGGNIKSSFSSFHVSAGVLGDFERFGHASAAAARHVAAC